MADQGLNRPSDGAGDRQRASLPESLWVVVPACNEEQRIGTVLEGLLPFAANIVVVDDGSQDATAARALERPIWLLRHGVNLGQGAALQTGIRFALSRGAGYVATFDGDGQHDAADLVVLYRTLISEGAHFVLGSRFLGGAEGIPTGRKVVLRLGILFTRLLSGVRLSDVHNGIRVMTRRGAEQIRITLNRMEHASEIIDQVAASGLKYVEAPVTIRYTAESLAKGQKTSASIKLGVKLLLERMFR